MDVTDDDFIESQVNQGWHKNRAKMEERIGLVCSPLHQAILEPDTILIFGNGAHITHIIQALCYDYTIPLMSTFEGFGESA